MKLTSIKWLWFFVVWFNYQNFICCNGNTTPCQPNFATSLPVTSDQHPENSVNRTDNDIWIGFLAGYGNSKVGGDYVYFIFMFIQSVHIEKAFELLYKLLSFEILTISK